MKSKSPLNLALIRHDIKNRLAAAKLLLEILLKEVPGPLTPEQKEMLEDIQNSNEKIITIVNQVKDEK